MLIVACCRLFFIILFVSLFSESTTYKPKMGAVKIYWMLVTLATPPFTSSSSLDLGASSSLNLEVSPSLDLEAGPTSVGSPSFWDEDDDSTGVQLEVTYHHVVILYALPLAGLNRDINKQTDNKLTTN